jgi:hypothetical protein
LRNTQQKNNKKEKKKPEQPIFKTSNDFVPLTQLGKGSFGVVYLVREKASG